MEGKEYLSLIIAAIILTIIVSINSSTTLSLNLIMATALFSIIVIATNIIGKKVIAHQLDSDVEHELWYFKRYGFKPSKHLTNSVPLGIIAPLFFSLISVGYLVVSTFLTYESRPMKKRAVRRFGVYSFTEMTDWHIALIGAGGIIASLLLSFVTYWIPGLEILTRTAAYYAFWNLIPFSKLDGTQIYMGSRVLWSILVVISIVFALAAFLIV